MLRLHGLASALALVLVAGPVWAADTSSDAPAAATATDLAPIRAQIKAADYKSAIAALQPLADQGSKDPDVYNLLGFSLRKSGDRKTAQTFYEKALAIDPNHKGTLEYQGELFVENGDIPKAQQNLAALVKLCPNGCEEREDLEKALTQAAKPK
ncbi:tetratricopeptide repeat protein [Labrys sp. La1]|uniref:tetratricopeptide repeat protein n=1 Tax=Labrys sp. La1 TaxID=3404917 RepID=UPI003EC14B04